MRADALKPSPWLIEYVDRLISLHHLIARNEGDSEAADAIRDEMDLPWRNMSEFEIGLVGDLSTDLYTTTDSNGMSAPAKAAERVSSELHSRINEALQQKQYREVLRLLRDNQLQVKIPAAAFLRGVSWFGLGLPSAAAEFFLHAERTDPGLLETRLCALSSMISGMREKDALPFAEDWVKETPNPVLALKASAVLFVNAVRHPDNQSPQRYSKSIALAEQFLASRDSSYESEDQVLTAFLQIAVAYAYLGDIQKARDYSHRARQHSPDNVVAMMVDGMLNDTAPPVSDAGKREVARHIVSIPENQLAAYSSIIQHSHHLNQISVLN